MVALHLTGPATSEAKVLANVLHHLDDDIEVDLVLNDRGAADGRSVFAALQDRPGIRLHHVDVGLPIDPWTPPSKVRRLAARALHPLRRELLVRRVRDLQPHIVYTSQQRFDCRVGEIIATRLRVPQVVHLHYTVGPWLRSNTLRRLLTCERVIAVSEFIARDASAHGVPRERITTIHNALPADGSTVDHDDGHAAVVIGQVGRLVPGKGFDETVEVFRRVHAERQNTRLVLVGDGEDREAIRQRVHAHGLDAAVELTGWQADVGACLQRMDVFLNPSRQEPFGLTVLEAMQHRLPVVSYRDGGIPEIVVHGATGWLVEPGDLDGLTRHVMQLVDDAGLRRRLGAAGRTRAVEEFAPERAGREFSALLRGHAPRAT